MSKETGFPDGWAAVTPYLVVKGAAEAITFYIRAFGAKELYRLTEPSGKIGHAELDIRGSRVMLTDEYPDFGALSPATVGGSPVRFHLYTADADAVAATAVAAGATMLRPVKDQFFGDRSGLIADPFGHEWFIVTKIEDVTPAKMQERWNEAFV